MHAEPPQPAPTLTNKWLAKWQAVRRWLGRGWLFATGILAAFLGLLLYSYFYPQPTPLTTNEVSTAVAAAMASATPAPPDSALVYQMILPSLVFIQTSGQNPENRDRVGVGSGVVVNANGAVLTAYHVVAEATLIELFFADGSESTAVIESADPTNDIAVLQPLQPPQLIVPAVLGSANTMRVGDQAFAVGNPMGLVASLSAGVISGFGRAIPIGEDGQQLEGLIQFDTAVNPGNSGGPLLNRQGHVIGIVTALANPAQQNFFVGIGFAVPIQTAVAAAGGPPY